MKFWILVWSFFCLKTTACLIVNAARERMKTNMKQIWKKSNWEIQLSENPKLVAELSQTGGRQKSSSTAAPSALVRGWSMRKCEITCGESQFCAELSTFNENFCHNLPWKKNSPLSGHSFSQLTTKWVGEPDYKISHLWLKIAINWLIFSLFWQIFCPTDYIYAYFKLEMHQ